MFPAPHAATPHPMPAGPPGAAAGGSPLVGMLHAMAQRMGGAGGHPGMPPHPPAMVPPGAPVPLGPTGRPPARAGQIPTGAMPPH